VVVCRVEVSGGKRAMIRRSHSSTVVTKHDARERRVMSRPRESRSVLSAPNINH